MIVLSQDKSGEWMVLQEELSGLSSQSEWRVVEGASHMGLLTDPKFASQTAAAIQALVRNSRGSTMKTVSNTFTVSNLKRNVMPICRCRSG